MKIIITCIVSCVTIGATTLGATTRADAVEICGLVQQQTRDPGNSQRFWLLADYGGKAFLDLKTCLVVSTDIAEDRVTLSEAMERCSMLGQGGPHGEMGWQLPTMAELTSLDSELWASNQAGAFKDYKIPPMGRSETAFWTSTSWLGEDESYATVTFSAPTTLVRPMKKGGKAGVWCVQGIRATGLK